MDTDSHMPANGNHVLIQKHNFENQFSGLVTTFQLNMYTILMRMLHNIKRPKNSKIIVVSI